MQYSYTRWSENVRAKSLAVRNGVVGRGVRSNRDYFRCGESNVNEVYLLINIFVCIVCKMSGKLNNICIHV